MKREEILQTIREACEARSLCALYLKGEAAPRIIHPYGVCFSRKDNLLLVAVSEKGFSKSNNVSLYRNFLFDRIQDVHVLENSFEPLHGFNPFSEQYSGWLFHILGKK